MSTPTFTNFEAALVFLVRALDAHDYEAIAEACVDASGDANWDEASKELRVPSMRQARLQAVKLLADRHGETSLLRLYAGRSFPLTTTKYKLGGHASELGHLHVDFVGEAGYWQLKEIWLCR